MANIAVKSGGSWKIPIFGIDIKSASAWKRVKSIEYKDGGTWKYVFNVSVPYSSTISESVAVPAEAKVVFAQDGTLYFTTGSSGGTTIQWFTPTGGTPGNDHYFRFTLTGSAPTFQFPSFDVWTTIPSGTQTRVNQNVPGNTNSDFIVQIATDSGGSNIIAQGVFTISATHT